MSRAVVILSVAVFLGSTLMLSELRWFRRPGLADRLSPYTPGMPRSGHAGVLSADSFRDVIGPLSRVVGAKIAQAFGVREDLETRLRRVHEPIDATAFRVRQAGWATTALIVGALLATALELPASLSALAVLGSPVLAFLALEQRLANASEAHQRRIFLELPVVAEQLGMLMSAGWSLTASLDRIADRGTGSCALDLRRVRQRLRQGLSEVDALREWSDGADVDALDHLVSVLALNREAADLGRLVSDEARAVRRDAQRELIETIESRSQQVWIPVTVAALVPGVLLMGVPFIDALALFSSS